MKYDECNTKPLSEELFRFFTMRDAMNATVRSRGRRGRLELHFVLSCIRRSCELTFRRDNHQRRWPKKVDLGG